jgi:hypothetical protein
MKVNVYKRFQVDVRREGDSWAVYRLAPGKRMKMNDVVLSPVLWRPDQRSGITGVAQPYIYPDRGDTMKILFVSIFTSLMAVSLAVPAQTTQSTVTTSPGSGRSVQTTKTTATVVGIVPSTRTVSLKRADGQIVEIQVGEEVRNLDKIKVGDTVTAEYTQALSLDLKKGGVGAARKSESVEMTRAPRGAQPAGKVGTQVTILADVIGVNAKDKVVTLRGPHGNLVDLKVQDPEQLKLVKQGDQVQAVYTEALAIAVEPASPPQK